MNSKYDIACMWELEHDKPYFLFGISVWRYFALPGFLIVIAMLPMFMATYVAITRVVDYHHHYEDVLAGAMLGTFWAVVGFATYKDEFRESSVKHELLFEHFTNDIKQAFLKHILKDRSSTYTNTGIASGTHSKDAFNTITNNNTTTNNTNNTAINTTDSTHNTTLNNNNNNTNINSNTSNENNKNLDYYNSSLQGSRKSRSRSIFFWCKMLCFSCNDDCQRVWKICLCRHSDTDYYHIRKKQESLLTLDGFGIGPQLQSAPPMIADYGYGVNYGGQPISRFTYHNAQLYDQIYNSADFKNKQSKFKHANTLDLSVGIDKNQKNNNMKKIKLKNNRIVNNNGGHGTSVSKDNKNVTKSRGFRYDAPKSPNSGTKPKNQKKIIRSKTDKNLLKNIKNLNDKNDNNNTNDPNDINSVGNKPKIPERAISGPSRTFEPNKTFKSDLH